MSDQYYRFFPGDYLRDTGDLSLVEHGAYRILLDHYYTQEFLPSDKERLYRICRAFTQEEKQAIDTVVSRFFTDNGAGKILNKKAEKELEGRKTYNETLRARGKAGANARWGQEAMLKQCLSNAQAMPNKCHPSPSPSPLPIPKQKKHTKKSVSVFALPDWFPQEVWTEFLAHRKAIKAPVPEASFQGFVSRFQKLRDQGWDPRRVVDTMLEKGWRWFRPEWLEKSHEGRQQQTPLSRQKATDIIDKWKQESMDRDEDIPF